MATRPVKTGDTVEVIAGKARGKTGKVLQVFPRLNRVSVQGINLVKRHVRNRRGGDQAGQVVQFPMPVHVSNVRVTAATEASETKTEEAGAKKKTVTRKAKT